MSHGGGRKAVPMGTTRVSSNGYQYIKTNGGWMLTHHMLAEEKLGRPIDTRRERIYFIDNDRTNLTHDNIGIADKTKDRQKRREQIENKIAVLQEALRALEREER